MCGIIGILGRQPAAPLLVDGLKRLAYRGYDSAGVGFPSFISYTENFSGALVLM